MALDDPDPLLMNQAYGEAPPPDTQSQSPVYAPWDWVPPSWGPAPAPAPQSAPDVAPPTPEQIEAPPAPPVTPSTPSPDVPVSTDATGAVTPPPVEVTPPEPQPVADFQQAPFGTPPPAQPGDAPAPYTIPVADLAAPAAPPLPPAPPPAPVDGLVTHPNQTAALPPDVVTSPQQLTAPTEPPAPVTQPYQTAPSIPLTPEQASQQAAAKHYAATVKEFSSHPLDIPDPEERQRFLNDLAKRSPEAFAELQARDELAKQREFGAKKLKLATEDFHKEQQNYDDLQTSYKATQAKLAAIDADSTRIANTKIDPSGGLSEGERIGGILMAIIGGFIQGKTGSATNMGLDLLNQKINRGIERQKAELQMQREGVAQRRGAVAEEFALHGDMFRAQEAVRQAAYKYADAQLATEQQNFAPGGTTDLRIAGIRSGIAGQMATNARAIGRQDMEDNLKQINTVREAALADSTIAKNKIEMDKLRAETAKLAHAGDGTGAARVAGADPKYTVDTGFTNPFDNTQPLFGVRQIGGKGEDAKERKEVGAAINTYGHVQDYWAKLAAIGDQIDNAKSAGESVWKARKSTLGAEYDAAREALTVYLTKELGDKLTQGQLEAQAHRIPERASLFEARDPGKQIRDAQSDADRDFSRDMTLVGIDPTPVIRSAQQHRAVARPTPVQQLDAANAALAEDPSNKDAKFAKDAAEQRVKDEAIAAQNRAGNVATASTLSGPVEPLPEPSPGDTGDSFAVDHSAAVTAANRSAAKYADLLKQYKQQSATSAHLAGMKQPGDIAAAKRVHEHEVGDLAGEVVKARDQYERDFRKAHEVEATRHLADRVRQAGELVHAGIDPTTGQPLGAAPAPALPDQSYRPGTEPLVPPLIPDPLNTPTYRTSKGKH